MTNRYLHGPAVDQVFADENALGEILWGLADDQGTVRDVADYDAATDTTTVKNHRKFDAFGNITAQSDPTVDFRCADTGRFFDADTSLQYNRARWYDARVGRWKSEDPIGFAAGEPAKRDSVRCADQSKTLPRSVRTADPTWLKLCVPHGFVVVCV
ncbi:MAG: RHS repeat-associated core domain-containing protein, partial [Planctomycetaceae bacterium]